MKTADGWRFQSRVHVFPNLRESVQFGRGRRAAEGTAEAGWPRAPSGVRSCARNGAPARGPERQARSEPGRSRTLQAPGRTRRRRRSSLGGRYATGNGVATDDAEAAREGNSRRRRARARWRRKFDLGLMVRRRQRRGRRIQSRHTLAAQGRGPGGRPGAVEPGADVRERQRRAASEASRRRMDIARRRSRTKSRRSSALGLMYANGAGTAADPAQAASWFTKAAAGQGQLAQEQPGDDTRARRRCTAR